jgi:hypothetical protein
MQLCVILAETLQPIFFSSEAEFIWVSCKKTVFHEVLFCRRDIYYFHLIWEIVLPEYCDIKCFQEYHPSTITSYTSIVLSVMTRAAVKAVQYISQMSLLDVCTVLHVQTSAKRSVPTGWTVPALSFTKYQKRHVLHLKVCSDPGRRRDLAFLRSHMKPTLQ